MNINEVKSAKVICVETDAFRSWHDAPFYFQWPFVCTHYSLNPFLPTPSKFRMNVTICMLEREKGQLIEVKRFLNKYCIIIVAAAAVVFTVIIMMPHMPLCTCCSMLGTTSPKKNKCGRDRRVGCQWEKSTGAQRPGQRKRCKLGLRNKQEFNISESTAQQHLEYSQIFNADLILMATSYYDRFSCSRYSWLYDVYKPNVSSFAPNLTLRSKNVSLDMALFLQSSFLLHIFLMIFKIGLLIFLPKLNLSPNLFFYRYFQTQKLTFIALSRLS